MREWRAARRSGAAGRQGRRESDVADRSAGSTDPRPDEVQTAYEKPAIAWEEDLDVRPTLIAGCGKVEMSEASCLATGPGS